MEGFMTLAEAAEMLAVNKRTITRWIGEGKLSGANLHNRWYISENSVNTYIEGLSATERQLLELKRRELAAAGSKAAKGATGEEE